MSDSGFKLALSALARRPLTTAELRQRLEQRGIAPAAIDSCVARLEALGYLNDAQLALDYTVARAQRLRHGKLRIVRELIRRGVPERVAEAAWVQAVDEHDIDPQALLQQRVEAQRFRAGGRFESDDCRRVYDALIRAGFEATAVREALEPHFPEFEAEPPQRRRSSLRRQPLRRATIRQGDPESRR